MLRVNLQHFHHIDCKRTVPERQIKNNTYPLSFLICSTIHACQLLPLLHLHFPFLVSSTDWYERSVIQFTSLCRLILSTFMDFLKSTQWDEYIRFIAGLLDGWRQLDRALSFIRPSPVPIRTAMSTTCKAGPQYSSRIPNLGIWECSMKNRTHQFH